MNEIKSYLDHELRDDAVEGAALVAKALLASCECTEVLRGLRGGLENFVVVCIFQRVRFLGAKRRHFFFFLNFSVVSYLAKETKDNAASRLVTNRDVCFFIFFFFHYIFFNGGYNENKNKKVLRSEREKTRKERERDSNINFVLSLYSAIFIC